jgi:signal transduction histidine kinase
MTIEILLLIGTLSMVFLALAIVFFVIIYQRRLYLEKEKQRIQEQIHQKALFRAGFESQEIERKRIAQDLHDEIGENLSTLILYTNLLVPETNSNEQIKEALQESKTLINNTLQNVRNISEAISPMVLEKFGLKKSVDQIAEGVNLSKHTHCKVLIEDSFPHLRYSPRTLYLQNHSRARQQCPQICPSFYNYA